ncbi:MAG: ABC-F family ATP-binding cassette domain-containing protein [bacterium]|nr:ABC-F family ATP-binding cassette domain-containing protein [bacterium]
MSILTAEGLTRRHGDLTVFEGVDLSLARGDRMAVVGPNGSGKTTLLRVLAGLDEPDEGRLHLAGGIRVGYLPQEIGQGGGIDPGRTVLQVAGEPLAYLDAWENQLRRLEGEMSRAGPAIEECLREYGRLSDRFEAAAGYERHARVEAVLRGLGFGDQEWGLPAGNLSGGQRTRLGLARLLLEGPDLLLLDEPTNHLDLEANEWLEEHLAAARSTFVVVAHDRRFLDRLTNSVLELEAGRGRLYRGNYSAFARQAAERRSRQELDARTRERERERLEAYVRRYRAGNRAVQARSRQKALDRMEPAPPPPPTARSPLLRITAGRSSGREVLKVTDLAAGYGGALLFSGVNLELRRGDRLGVAGPNGSGKSTLVRVILGLQPAAAGTVEWGHEVDAGYFAQVDDSGDGEPAGSALERFCDRTGMLPGPARLFLARFGLVGETPLGDVASLSGGERTRLRLAELVAGRPNLLVLDEPTHHLDLPAREALAEALAVYPGTLILVTHDRYLLERMAGRLLYLRQGEVRLFDGGLQAFRVHREEKAVAPRPSPTRQIPAARRTGGGQLDALEQAIGRLEEQRARLEDLLASPHTYQEGDPAAVSREYREVTRQLEELYRSWEAAAGEGEA